MSGRQGAGGRGETGDGRGLLAGVRARHDVDRAFKELLEEERIAQMAGQILLGFLFAVAYTPTMDRATPGDRALYAWALGVATAAVVLLLSTVPLHRVNFGRRLRPSILVLGHVLACVGLTALGFAIVLSVWLAGRMAVPDLAPALAWSAVGLVLVFWLATPLWLRWSSPSRLPPAPDGTPPRAPREDRDLGPPPRPDDRPADVATRAR